MADVFANNRSILHKGDGLQHVSAPPDVCKTPTPGGPAPLPYPNMAMDSDLAKGAKKVKINGKPVAHEKSNLKTSTGDEAGTAGGGIVSNKFKGKMTWSASSTDVKVEGKGVARFMDPAGHNNNTENTAFLCVGSGNTHLAYADDFTGPCEICRAGPAKHRIHETNTSANYAKDVIKALHQTYQSISNPPKKWSNGFMIGVMICKCPNGQSKVWVAKSGKSFLEFENAARVRGVHKVIGGGFVTIPELVSANQSMLGIHPMKLTSAELKAALLSNSRKKELHINDAWNTVERARERNQDGYSPPGSCAAQKLLTRADGHAPLEMTEMYFEPNATSTPWHKTYTWRVGNGGKKWTRLSELQKKAVLQNKQSIKGQKMFRVGESIGSCNTCQAILYLTNCPERNCK